MSVAVVTGSSGLIGSETVKFLHEKGLDVTGIDNNLREYFFGPDGSVAWKTAELVRTLPRFTHLSLDVRDTDAILALFSRLGRDVELVVHAAAQPSHDWAAREPLTDFTVNANGTLSLLEATRLHSPDATFIFTSTNKVYGDTPNRLPLVEQESRFELAASHPYCAHGVDETMSIDTSTHSLMGASKVAADMLTQEYGRYFGLHTGIFRGGCLTGPAHSGAELHGFLAYVVKCVAARRPYTVMGYGGKQVRDNIHSRDLVEAFWQFHQNPRVAEVYNIGGSRHSNCSVLEAISLAQELIGEELRFTVADSPRRGDHVWWISDVRKFQSHHPGWHYRYDLETMMKELAEVALERRP